VKLRGALTVLIALALAALVAAGGFVAWPRIKRRRALERALDAARAGGRDRIASRIELLGFDEPEATAGLIDSIAGPRPRRPILLPACSGVFVVTERAFGVADAKSADAEAAPFIEAVELAGAAGDDAARLLARRRLERLAREERDLDARWCALYGLLELDEPRLSRAPVEDDGREIRLSDAIPLEKACETVSSALGRPVRVGRGVQASFLKFSVEARPWRALLIATQRAQNLGMRASPEAIEVVGRSFPVGRSVKSFGFTSGRGGLYGGLVSWPKPEDDEPEPRRMAALLADMAERKLAGAELIRETPDVLAGDPMKALRALAQLNGCELREEKDTLRVVGK
jgi:hypothetical protein